MESSQKATLQDKNTNLSKRLYPCKILPRFTFVVWLSRPMHDRTGLRLSWRALCSSSPPFSCLYQDVQLGFSAKLSALEEVIYLLVIIPVEVILEGRWLVFVAYKCNHIIGG